MANKPNQKLRLLRVLSSLMEKTSDEQGLTTQQIIEELAYYDLEAERKTIYSDIQALRSWGLIIEQQSGTWRLLTRPFDLQEMIMLLDAVQSSPFLTEEVTDSLIGKIQQLASVSQREMLQRRIEVPSRVKMQNSAALENIDIIQQAMRLKKQIEFHYFHYDAKKQRILNRDGNTYTVTPVRLIYADELYYLIAFMERWAHDDAYQPFTPYRVDRMCDLRLSIEPIDKDRRIATYDLEEHVSPAFGIYAVEKTAVTLELDERAMNPLVDKFGIDALTFTQKDGEIRAHVAAPLSPQFYGWLVQLGTYVKILSPKRAMEEFTRQLGEIQSLYQEEEKGA